MDPVSLIVAAARQGGQFGDHNAQTNTFTTAQPPAHHRPPS
ncbi:MAG TPA: hypothetical protein VGP26_31125 [Actinophytocola sp.]|jgi:hypothetical protein|nr:hypothetical protein [Actinophytocola sp.]